MANKDKALREGGLAAICRHLVEYFKKTDTAGATLIQLAEATEQGFSDAETGISAAAETAQAEHVTFSDGQTLQQKFSGNALGGVTSVNGVTGDVTIGGRNLALDTAEEKVSTAKDAATMGVHWELSDYGKSVLNTVGTPVVLSYEAKADVEGQRVSVNLRVGTSGRWKIR